MDSLAILTLDTDAQDARAVRVHTSPRHTRMAGGRFAGLVFSLPLHWNGDALTQAQEAALLAACKRGDKEAWATLLVHTAPLIDACAGHVAQRYPNAPHEDIRNEGHLAMVQSVERFDPDKDTLFTTYCRFHIMGRMVQSAIVLSCAISAGRSTQWRRKMRAFLTAWLARRDALDHDPMDCPCARQALAQELGLPLPLVVQLHAFLHGNTAALQEAAGENAPHTFQDDIHALITTCALEACACGKPTQRAILRALAQGDPNQPSAERFGALAQAYGLTTRRIRQLHSLLLERMRQSLEQRGIRSLDDAIETP